MTLDRIFQRGQCEDYIDEVTPALHACAVRIPEIGKEMLPAGGCFAIVSLSMTSFAVGFHFIQSNLQRRSHTNLVILNRDSPLIPAGCLNKEEYEYPENQTGLF